MLKDNRKMVSVRLAPDVVKNLKLLSSDLGSSQGELIESLVRCLRYHKEYGYEECDKGIWPDGLHRSFSNLLDLCRFICKKNKEKEEAVE